MVRDVKDVGAAYEVYEVSVFYAKVLWEEDQIKRHHDGNQLDGMQPHKQGHFKTEPYPLIWQCLPLKHIGLEAAKRCTEPEAHVSQAYKEDRAFVVHVLERVDALHREVPYD
jgi:hypothetical protein